MCDGAMKKFAIIAAFILLSTFVGMNIGEVSGKTIYVGEGGDYATIQDAIDNASDGDKIYVLPGIYHEHITVHKSLSISGEDTNSTIVDADYSGNAISITSNSVKISNLTVREGGGGAANALIKVASNKNEIKNCILKSCRNGIFVTGNSNFIEGCRIYENGNGLEIKSSGNEIKNCVIHKNGMGVEAIGAHNNTISECTFHTNGIGIYMENSSANKIRECSVYKNSGNEGGIFLLNSDENIISNSSIAYNVWSVRLVASNKNEIRDCEISESRFGVRIENSIGNEISKCNITHNRYGVYMEKCLVNKVIFNNIAGNHMYGLYAKESIGNARFNWWGSVAGPMLENRVESVLGKVSYRPWLLRPVDVQLHEKPAGVGERASPAPSNLSVSMPASRITSINLDDWDPLVDLKLKVDVLRVRHIGLESKNLFSVIHIYKNKNESEAANGFDISPDWKAVQDVPDDKENIPVVIQIFEKGLIKDKEVIEVKVVYNMERGEWYGDDYVGDDDGCGHVVENGYEVWFDISFNDYDGDGLTYWEETNVYHTDPRVDDRGSDVDGDGIPIEWEDKWGYNPLIWENFSSMDPDKDGLTNIQEWQQSEWLSDPFRKDIFMEVDNMVDSRGNLYGMPEKSKQLLYSSFTKHNIMMHIDDGSMGGGGEEIPYKEKITYHETNEIYWKYFLHDNITNERKGVFHYVIFCSYGAITRGGYSFQAFDNLDGFVLAIQYIKDWRIRESQRELSTASLFMHELGHNLGLFEYTFGGIDNESCNTPWHAGWWKYANYKSCLNYRYAFSLVDYSDGSRVTNDYDDWGNIDLTFFTNSTYYV